MHASVRNALCLWLEVLGGAAGKTVADVGAYNLNGSVKEVLPHAIGFDLVPGPGVDVVVPLGSIPAEHRNRYDLVTSISSFQFCPYPREYKNELLELLKPNGLLFLTMCAASCTTKHTTVPPYEDCLRMTIEELTALMGPEIVAQDVHLTQTGYHSDVIFVGERL
jgi:hypothetical protein